MSTIERKNKIDISHVEKIFNTLNLQSELQELMKGLNDGERHELHPLQREFLIRLQKERSQDEYTQQEQICISHCIKYDHYSDIHRNTLNNLIRKYA